MSEQLSPEQVTENKLICEKLLGWLQTPGDSRIWFIDPTNSDFEKRHQIRGSLPSFTTWAEAGLILEAMQKLTPITLRWSHGAQYWFIDLDYHGKSDASGPLAIRAAALEYIKAVMT